MGLENPTYINGLVPANPDGSDPKYQGDNHLRIIKSSLLNTFPNITGAMTASQAALNYVSNLTGDVQAQINLKANIASPVFTGTPQAPYPADGDFSSIIPTTSWVQTALNIQSMTQLDQQIAARTVRKARQATS